MKRWQAEGLKRGIVRREGMEVFERVLSGTHPQVLVSTTSLIDRLRQAAAPAAPVQPAAAPVVRASATHPRPALATAYQQPRTEVETRVGQLWEELLGIKPVGTEDDFLALGGHSLLAIQLISRLRDAFNVEISVQTFFENPTVAGLARVIGGDAASSRLRTAFLRPRPWSGFRANRTRAVRTADGVTRVSGSSSHRERVNRCAPMLTAPRRTQMPAARLRLYCFPYAGGGPWVFRPWADFSSRRGRGLRRATAWTRCTRAPGTSDRLRLIGAGHHEDVRRRGRGPLRVLRPQPGSAGRIRAGAGTAPARPAGTGPPVRVRISPPHNWLSSRSSDPNLPDDEFVAGLRELRGTPEKVRERRTDEDWYCRR